MVTGSFHVGIDRLASVVLALVGGVFAGHRIMRKIESVSETTRDIVAGDLTRRVRVSTAGDEFDNLAASINSMLDRIEAAHERAAAGDYRRIAHDLRTPLQPAQAAAGESPGARRRMPAASCARISRRNGRRNRRYFRAFSGRSCASRRSRAVPVGRDLHPSTMNELLQHGRGALSLECGREAPKRSCSALPRRQPPRPRRPRAAAAALR